MTRHDLWGPCQIRARSADVRQFIPTMISISGGRDLYMSPLSEEEINHRMQEARGGSRVGTVCNCEIRRFRRHGRVKNSKRHSPASAGPKSLRSMFVNHRRFSNYTLRFGWYGFKDLVKCGVHRKKLKRRRHATRC